MFKLTQVEYDPATATPEVVAGGLDLLYRSYMYAASLCKADGDMEMHDEFVAKAEKLVHGA